MKTVTLCGITFGILGGHVVAVKDGELLGDTTVADAIRQAKWLRVLVEFAAIKDPE